jgi:hypothetical protein
MAALDGRSDSIRSGNFGGVAVMSTYRVWCHDDFRSAGAAVPFTGTAPEALGFIAACCERPASLWCDDEYLGSFERKEEGGCLIVRLADLRNADEREAATGAASRVRQLQRPACASLP